MLSNTILRERPLITASVIPSTKPAVRRLYAVLEVIHKSNISPAHKAQAISALEAIKRETRDAGAAALIKSFVTCVCLVENIANIIDFLLEMGFDINIRFDLENRSAGASLLNTTCLHLAVLHNKPDKIRVLLQRGANPLLKDEDGETPLHCISDDQQIDSATIFLASLEASVREAVLNQQENKHGGTILMRAVTRGDSALTKTYITAGADVRQVDHYGYTALHWAAAYGARFAYSGKIEDPAPSTREFSNSIPVERKIRIAQYKEIVNLLLENGADLNIVAHNGNQPIHQAATFGIMTIIKQLIDAGANVNATNYFGTVIDNLIYAWKWGNLPEPEVHLRHLMSAGAYATNPALAIYFNTEGYTQPFEILCALAMLQHTRHPFIQAVRRDDIAYLRVNPAIDPILLSEGLFNAIALSPDHQFAICEYLLEQGADPNATLNKNSPLHVLAIMNNKKKLDLTNLLIIHGANIHTHGANDHGETLNNLYKAAEWTAIKAKVRGTATAKPSSSVSSKTTEAFKKVHEQIHQTLRAALDLLRNNAAEAVPQIPAEAQQQFAELERLAENNELWAEYTRLLSQYQYLCERIATVSRPQPAAETAEEITGEVLYVQQIRQRFSDLIARHQEADSAAKARIEQQIQYNLIHLLEAHAKSSRAAYHLRQLMVHAGHRLLADPSYLLELAELFKLSAATTAALDDDQVEQTLSRTICYQRYIVDPFIRHRQRPEFVDQRPPQEAIASFMAACQTLINAQAVLSAAGSPAYQDQAELARLAIYQLREFLRIHTEHSAWQHPVRDLLLARISDIAGEALATQFRRAVCEFGSEAIHNLYSIQIDNIAWESISTHRLRKAMELCRALIAAGVCTDTCYCRPPPASMRLRPLLAAIPQQQRHCQLQHRRRLARGAL